jgi:hypothetical protein
MIEVRFLTVDKKKKGVQVFKRLFGQGRGNGFRAVSIISSRILPLGLLDDMHKINSSSFRQLPNRKFSNKTMEFKKVITPIISQTNL